jgi:hypothetical protein
MKYFQKFENKVYLGIFVLIIVIALMTPVLLYVFTKFEKEITIKDKYIRYRKNASNYNVVDSNNNIYQLGNLWFKGDFNRAEDYINLEVGNTYIVTGYGMRIPVLDMYKTIYELKVVN